MNAPTGRRAALRRLLDRPRVDQRGFTLIEVLLVVGITGLLLGPLLAWTVLVMRQQPVEQDGMVRTAQASLLRTHFAPDVLGAGAADDYSPGPVDTDPRWATWRQECVGGGGEGGRPLVVLLTQRDEVVKTVYSVAPADDGSGEPALWRDRCGAGDGVLIDTTQVVERVVDDPARTTGRCWSRQPNPGDDAEQCRQVSLSVAVPEAADLVELSATRRTDARSLDRDVETGNILPIAIIDVERTPVGGPTPAIDVRVSGARSSDPDGDDGDLTFSWQLPTGPDGAVELYDGVEHTIRLSELRTYVARLTVTDPDGGTSSTYRRIATVTNQAPLAEIEATPKPVVAGESTLSLSAAGSSDPDGVITDHQWRIYGEEFEGAEGLELLLPGENAQWPVPDWVFGNLVVELTVTDDRGATHMTSEIVQVLDPLLAPGDEDVDPNDPDPTAPADPGDPDPEPGAPVADLVVRVGADRQVTLDAGGSTGDGLTYTWAPGLLAGPAPTGGPSVTHTYPAIGTYTARVSITDAQGRTATRAALVVIPGQPAAPQNVRVENGALVWNPRPGARRYFVDMVSTGPGCARAVTNLVTAASEAPRRALPPNPCGSGSTVEARVGTESVAGGPVAWSGWIDVPNEVTK